MRDRIRLPGTELDVSRLCLGGNRLGGDLGQNASFALLDAFVELGGNFLDTAHVYADWIPGNEKSSSEKTLGRWLRSRRPQGIVIATKGGHPGEDGARRLDPASLRRDAEEARGNLGVDTLDLFYVHRDDPARAAADILGALEQLRSDGLIRHYGASNWSAVRLEEAKQAAAAQGWQGFAANQCDWSLARRNAGSIPSDLHVMDGEMAAFHMRTGLAAIPYSAQAKGYFEKAQDTLGETLAHLYESPRNRALAGDLMAMAGHLGATPTQIMLGVLMRAPFPVVPVIGCRTPVQVAESFASLRVTPSPADIRSLLARALYGD